MNCTMGQGRALYASGHCYSLSPDTLFALYQWANLYLNCCTCIHRALYSLYLMSIPCCGLPVRCATPLLDLWDFLALQPLFISAANPSLHLGTI